jgi:MerR family mercuric resistance operon transcriptional regulator
MDTASARLAIGALAKRTGSHVETIRYYERVGLLPAPARSARGYRLYGGEHLKRLTFVRRARALGFSIDEVRRLLDLADHRRRPCAEVRDLAGAHLVEVRAKIADLQAMERVLAETVARCAGGRSARCALIDALYQGGPAAVLSGPGGPDGGRRRAGAPGLAAPRASARRRREITPSMALQPDAARSSGREGVARR